MSSKKTPLHDRTNLLPSSSSSSSSPAAARPKPSSTPSWRQPPLSFLAPSRAPSPAQLLAEAPASSSPLRRTGSDASGSRLVDAAGSSEVDGDGDYRMDDIEREQEGQSERARGKRRRVEFEDEVDVDEEEEREPVALFRPSGGNQRIPSTFIDPGRQMSAFEAMKRREMGFRNGASSSAFFFFRPSPPERALTKMVRTVSMRPYLRTMVSSNEEEVTRIPALRSERNFAPPFALAFTHGACPISLSASSTSN
jgi:hypothetical protein